MRFTNHFILFLFIFKQCYLELALLIWVNLTGTVFVCLCVFTAVKYQNGPGHRCKQSHAGENTQGNPGETDRK